ncbi:MAG: hypothetical protein KF824_11990 [Fimbriimonadaceae bacterium]|nr:MAG: hypothetical protein KF824_11990 [Fimbriimonadaceae bacterium]
MIWAQGSGCLIIWLLAGYWAGKKAQTLNLPSKPEAGILTMIAATLVMFVGMWLVGSTGGLIAGKLTSWAWIAVLLLGCIFVGGQALGAVWVLRSVVARETSKNEEASESQEREL